MKIIISLIIALLLIYSGAMSYFYFDLFTRNRQLTLGLDESQNFKKKLQDELARMDTQQTALQKENEQLKKESLEYLKREKALNDRGAQAEKIIKEQSQQIKDFKKQLQEAKKELGALKQENLRLADINEFAGNIQLAQLKEKITKLEADLSACKKYNAKQEALLHYNLGVGYTKNRNYAMAAKEYEKALTLNPDDADTHYNLGIIYDDWQKNRGAAVEHYKKYLELKPEAPDMDEVKEWIARLEKSAF